MADKSKPSRKSPVPKPCLHEPEHPIGIREVNGADRVGEAPKPYAGRTMAVCKFCQCLYMVKA